MPALLPQCPSGSAAPPTSRSLHMLGLGQKFPQYSLTGVVSADPARAFETIDSAQLAWRQAREELRGLAFPMLADVRRELSSALGILDPQAGVAQRATYIVDPQGVIRFAYATDLNVGRNPQEVLRVLDALQTEELC